MSLEDYVVAPPTAIKLEEKGFKAKAIYAWETYSSAKLIRLVEYDKAKWGQGYYRYPLIKTYILAQVLEELPKQIFVEEKTCSLIISYYSNRISYEYLGNGYFHNKTNLATAASNLWLWCEEMGYVK